jgi:choline-glycine betaine transporter
VTHPAIDEMSKFLIITACTFAVVFLAMVIFMYLQYQRQQRQAKQRMAIMATNSHRNMSPNVYASPPIVKVRQLVVFGF